MDALFKTEARGAQGAGRNHPALVIKVTDKHAEPLPFFADEVVLAKVGVPANTGVSKGLSPERQQAVW